MSADDDAVAVTLAERIRSRVADIAARVADLHALIAEADETREWERLSRRRRARARRWRLRAGGRAERRGRGPRGAWPRLRLSLAQNPGLRRSRACLGALAAQWRVVSLVGPEEGKVPLSELPVSAHAERDIARWNVLARLGLVPPSHAVRPEHLGRDPLLCRDLAYVAARYEEWGR